MSDLARLQSQSERDFLHAMAKKRREDESADFIISSHGKEFKVHKFVLSLHSKYFDRLFKSNHKVNSDHGPDNSGKLDKC